MKSLKNLHILQTLNWRTMGSLICLMLFSFLGSNLQAQCAANAGMLMPDPAVSDQCINEGETVTFWGAHVPGNYPTVPTGYELIYVLTKGTDLVIVDTHKDPFFIVSMAGNYTVHTLVYDPTTLDLGTVELGVTTGFQVNALLIQGGGSICAALDVAGAPFSVTACEDGCSVNAGKIMTSDPTTICADDGEADPINVIQMMQDGGESSAWVITDESGKILALPAGPPFDLEGAGAGTCVIWYLVWDGELKGADVGKNANDLEGCYDLSNPISVTRLTGEDCDKPCLANAGKLMIDPNTGNDCLKVGEMVQVTAAHVPSNEPVVPAGSSVIYVLTKGNDLVIQGAAPTPVFNILEPGKFTIHTLVYDPSELDLGIVQFGITTGADVLGLIDANGLCASLDVAGAMYNIEACPTCDLDAGTISTDDPTTICADDGEANPITVAISGASGGSNSAWVITDESGKILALPTGPTFDLEGAGAGTCLIWFVVHDGSLTGATVGNTAPADLGGCYDLSNSIAVVRNTDCGPKCDLDAGTISTDDPTTICADDGEANPITVAVSGATAGTQSAWVITDETGKILAMPEGPTFDLEGAGAGTCLIWYVVHDGTLTGAAVGNTAPTDLGGCYDLSNPISVIRNTDCGPTCDVDGGVISTDDPTAICVDGIGDPINVTVTGSKGSNSAWVITDEAGNILALPTGPPFDLDGAGPGTCLIWYLRWDGTLSGATVGKNANDLSGDCFDLSNFITITRNEAPSVSDTGSTPTDECTGDGNNGTATVTVSGGMAPYTYAWSNGQSGATASGLAAGSYDVDITDAKGCVTQTSVEVGTMNSGVCVGDYVWLDGDRDGTQGQYENGVEGVEVRLLQAGPDGEYCTPDDVVVATATTDDEGFYEFCCLGDGEYSILFDPQTLPTDFIFTEQNAGGDDTKDSDADTESGKTAPFNITDGQADDFSFDAGIRRMCLNIDNGGEIGEDQTICRGTAPAAICATTSPSGGAGSIEYLWMTSTNEGPFDPDTWMPLDGANSTCYQPGDLFTTTYFVLCSRRAGCDAYTGESNIVKITVTDCRRGFVDFTADAVGVTEVSINWRTSTEEDMFLYEVQRSSNGKDFTTIKTIRGNGPGNVMNTYTMMDAAPKNGFNFYRVIQIDALGESMSSDIAEVMIMVDASQDLLAYPNPVRGSQLTIESVNKFHNAVGIKLLSASGKILKDLSIDQGAIQKNIDMSSLPVGMYFLQVQYSDSVDKVIKISKTE